MGTNEALPVIIPGLIFFVIDLAIVYKLIKDKADTVLLKLFVAFAVVVTLMQGLTVVSYSIDYGLINPRFIPMYPFYSLLIPFLSYVSYFWFLYFINTISGRLSQKWYIHIGYSIPAFLLLVLCVSSYWTSWIFSVDENGVYHPGEFSFLQVAIPYSYAILAMIVGIYTLRKKSRKEVDNALRFYLLYIIPSAIGAYVQLHIFRGGYTQISISCVLLILYVDLFVEAIEENKRLRSVEVLNKSLEKANEDLRLANDEQESQLEEISALNIQLQDNQANLEESYAEQEAQLEEISALNEKLGHKQIELEENLDIIAKTGYGIWKIQLSPDGHYKMFIDSTLKEVFGIEDSTITPEDLYKLYHSRLVDDSTNIEMDDYKSMFRGHLRVRNLTYNHPILGKRYLVAGGTSHIQPNGDTLISGYCSDITERVEQDNISNRTINALARTFMFINYILLDEGTFISSNVNTYFDDEDWKISKEGDLRNTIAYTIEHRVHPEYRSEVSVFANVDTLRERLKDHDILICQYKDHTGTWNEWAWIVADRNNEGIARHLIWSLRKIEDQKQAEIRKQRILEDNIAANKAKTVFLQNMSHEIRTPLNAMFGFSQLLGMPDGTWPEEEKQLYNRYIYNSYNMLDMLIGDIIDIADSENGNYRINISEVNVNDVCSNALMSVEYRVPQGVKSYFTSDFSDDYTIQSDGRRIQQVLINYLTNACKHTQEGEIHLHCSSSENPGKLTFSVTDTGEGVPADKAEVIFNRFTKLNQFVQGSGLGLNICQMIAAKLGGEVYLDKKYNHGARFVFVLDPSVKDN